MKSTTRITLATAAALIGAAISVGMAWGAGAPHVSSSESRSDLVALSGVHTPGATVASRALEAPSNPISCPAAESSNMFGCLDRYVLVGADGRPQGVTATGQASVKGRGTQVRDQAIQQAVADAKDQAQAAAQAAGVTLGAVIDIQISASGYPHPYALGEGAGVSGQAVPSGPATVPGAEPTITSCPPTTADCYVSKPLPAGPPIAVPVETFVSVTVTWSIAG